MIYNCEIDFFTAFESNLAQAQRFGYRYGRCAVSRRDAKIKRFYGQGADHKRIARYLAAWLGWAFVGVTACANSDDFKIHSNTYMYIYPISSPKFKISSDSVEVGKKSNVPVHETSKCDPMSCEEQEKKLKRENGLIKQCIGRSAEACEEFMK